MDKKRSLRGAPGFVSVIIPAHNAARTLAHQLEALSQQTYKGAWEVLVVDNRSDDGTSDVARDWDDLVPGLRVITANSGMGDSFARDAAFDSARGEFLLYCDADDVARADWVERMVAAAPSADIFGGALDFVTLNPPEVRAWQPAAGDGWKGSRDPKGAYGFLPAVIGANVGVWRDVVEAIGGWAAEPGLRNGSDLTLAWRAQLAGYQLAYVPDGVVDYRYRPTLAEAARQMYMRGKSEPHLYRLFRQHGMPRSSLYYAFKTWASLILKLPECIWSSRRRGLTVMRGSTRVGRLAGSIRWGVWFP